MIRRITDRTTFTLLRTASRVRCGLLTIRHAPPTAPDADQAARVAYAIGRPVGNAVVRNRLRRRLRALMSEFDRNESLPPGAYLIVAQPGAGTLAYGELRRQLQAGLAKLSTAGSPATVGATS